MQAQHHRHQAARLAALRAYDILDTPRESDFDQIVMLASQICQTPISVINLIDEHRQWFKAETGLGVRETPLDTSLCAHVILEDDFVEIEDTLADARMADNPLCLADPGLRFYAGALLKSAGGHPIGTLCVLDHMPRRLNTVQRDAIRVLAQQVVTQLDLRAVIAQEATLRSEIDHRVKNSLQTVAAFVALERRSSDSETTSAALERVERQIKLVAALHEHLCDPGNTTTIQLGPYLDHAVRLIRMTLPNGVAIEGNFQDIAVTARDASIVATIVNELVTNASKHSLTGGSGKIFLTGKRTADTGYQLECRDDGKAAAVSAHRADGRGGLGLKILNASVRQLGGNLSASHTEDGYSSRLEFSFRAG